MNRFTLAVSFALFASVSGAAVIFEQAALGESLPLVKAKPRPQLIGWLEHQGEHYGKLVTAYRANGIVPPVSRPKK